MTLVRSPDRTKKIWQLVFTRKGENGVYTRLFDNLDSVHRYLLRELVKLRGSDVEAPVVGSYHSEDIWMLLTTKRIVFRNNDRIAEVVLDEINDVKLDLKNLLDKGEGIMRVHQIILSKQGGGELRISLEPGRPLNGVLSILHNVRSRNKSVKKADQSL